MSITETQQPKTFDLESWKSKPDKVKPCVDWIVNGTTTGATLTGLKLEWALIWCLDGVAWGRCHDGAWQFSGGMFEGIVPDPKPHTIMEARLFNSVCEIHLWRDTEGNLTGRRLTHVDSKDAGCLKHLEETLILFGEPVKGQSGNGFALVADRGGARQVVPIITDKNGVTGPAQYLKRMHYFTRNPETGVATICVTRLAGISL